MSEKVLVCVKQGEVLSVPMKIKQKQSSGSVVPLDITGATVRVELKNSPYLSSEPFTTKLITETSDSATVGIITSPSNGELQIRFTLEDTSLPPNDYYIVIYLDMNGEDDIISSCCCNSSIYRICSQ